MQNLTTNIPINRLIEIFALFVFSNCTGYNINVWTNHNYKSDVKNVIFLVCQTNGKDLVSTSMIIYDQHNEIT